MKPQQDLRVRRSMWVVLSHPATSSAAVAVGTSPKDLKSLNRFVLPAAALALLALGQGRLQAQAWQPPNPYIQPVPNQRLSYAPPAQAYAPPTYNQQQYAQQPPYDPQQQQPYAQPQYAQQPHPPQPQQGPEQGPQQGYDQQQPYDQPAQGDPSDIYGPPQAAGPAAQPLNAEQLEQMVAPIALYPDTLVAQILAAATYPAQVAAADQWRQSMGYAPPDQIVAGADAQTWDPSVKALTAFPQVLAEMDRNLPWTTALGNAYFNQPQDVLQTIQVMRQRAESAGTLQNTPQEAVNDDQGYIQLAPVNSSVVYVPSYNPWDAYGAPVQPYSGFSLLGALGSIGSYAGSALLHYGPGIAMGAFRATPWGALAWGLDWLANTVLFNHSNYSSHSTSVAHWNLPSRSPRGFQGGMPNRAGVARPGEQYNRFPQGNNWAGRDSLPSRPMPFDRQPDRFAQSRPIEAPRPGFAAPERNGVRPAFGNYGYEPQARPQPYAARPQQAYSRAPEPVRPSYGQGYGSSFASRPGEGYGYRPGDSYGRTMPEYHAQATMPQRNFGERYSEPSMNRAFGGQQFRSEQ
ncbi:MAG: DUF3300 domain-containing protein, partial [Thermoplasmata archaeon]